MTTKIQKWGNSSAIRIPKNLMQNSKLVLGEEVVLELQDGFLIVKPKIKEKYTKPKYTIEELVKGITRENMHALVDWGPDVGAEILPPWEKK